MKGIYIHIPFCTSKCYYCDFNSYSNKGSHIDKYIDFLIKEINLYGESLKNANTIFIGGGTPTAIESKYIVRILSEIYKFNDKKNFLEVTIEANPGTIDEEKLNDYKNSGINRVSMGVQSLNDDILKEIGRTHNRTTVIESISMVKRYFENISIDMIFGLPNQTLNIIRNDLNESIDLGINHISYYALKIEEGTKLYEREEKGLLSLPSEEVEREMYHLGIDIFKENELYQYEISNFAKKGYESKHNLLYWNVEPYIGLGLSAASNIDKKRYNNVYHFDEYYNKIKLNELPIDMESMEEIDIEEEISEYCILRLRLNEGIIKSEFNKRFNFSIEDKYDDIIKKHIKSKLLIEDSKSIKLTDKGFDLANQVYMDFLN